MTMKKMLGAAVASACFGLMAPVAQASHVFGITFTPADFTVRPSAVGEAEAAFTARSITFNVITEVDTTGNGLSGLAGAGTFLETGAGNFVSFNNSLNNPIFGTGLGSSYAVYAVFQAAGTVKNNLAGGIDGSLSSFAVQVFVDKDGDTTFTTVTPGPAGGNESRTAVDATPADDLLVLTGTLLVGGFHVNAGLAAGDFDVEFLVTSCGAGGDQGFFCGAGGLTAGSTIGDLAGVNSTVATDTPFVTGAGDTRTDVVLTGAGQGTFGPFAVPEPATLGLLGLALAGMGFVTSRRRKDLFV